MNIQNIQTIAVSPRGRRYTVSFACIAETNEVALISEDDDKFIEIGGRDVNVFYSFADLSEIMTVIREKIVDLDVGFAADLQRSIDLHPAGKMSHLHIQ